MKALIQNNKVVQVQEIPFPVSASLFWLDCPDDCDVGWIYEDEVLSAPIPITDPVILGVLSTDIWSIPADGETFATVTFTSDNTVYFLVDSVIHTVEPINQIAAIEITADAPGGITVYAQDKQLVITAVEV